MTESLQRAFDAASQLPESEQDAIATWLLAELESERKWSDLLAASQDQLVSLANEALQENSRGETREQFHELVELAGQAKVAYQTPHLAVQDGAKPMRPKSGDFGYVQP